MLVTYSITITLLSGHTSQINLGCQHAVQAGCALLVLAVKG
jgi:hypothetical protein